MPTTIDKITAKFSQGSPMASVATTGPDGKPWVRYMMVSLDPDLSMWTTSYASARKIGQIRANPEVHLTFGVKDLPTAVDWVQVQARAEVITDEEEKRARWSDGLKDYYSGPDDPNYALIRFVPYYMEYWTFQSMEPEVWRAGE